MENIKRLLVSINGRNEQKTGGRSTPETFLFTTLWVISLLMISLPQGFKTRIGTINLSNNATPEQIRKAWGSGDAGSLMDTALTWVKKFNDLGHPSAHSNLALLLEIPLER